MRHKSDKVIAAAFVLAVTAAAAGCHSGSSSAQNDNGLRVSDSGSAQPAQTSAAPARDGSGTATQPAAPTATPTRAPASTTARAGAPVSGSKSGAASAAGTSRSGSGSAAKPPGRPTGYTRPGTYTYDLSGTATQPFGGTQKVSGSQSYVVDPPQGSTQHARTSGPNGSQDMTVTARSSGLYVDDIHISQQGFDEDFKPTGNALYFPADYRTGSHWSWQARSTDGKYAIAVTTKVAGSSTATVGGRSQKALVVDSTLHITGSGVDITDQQRDWVSPTYALILKEHAVTHGTAFGAKLSSDITRALRSTTPA